MLKANSNGPGGSGGSGGSGAGNSTPLQTPTSASTPQSPPKTPESQSPGPIDQPNQHLPGPPANNLPQYSWYHNGHDPGMNLYL